MPPGAVVTIVDYLDPTLVSVAVEIGWEREPFDALACGLLDRLGMPEWKLPETSRNLRRMFDLTVADGKSFSDAWEVVTLECGEIVRKNETFDSSA